MLTLNIAWGPENETGKVSLEDEAGLRLKAEVTLSSGLRLALALLDEPGLPEARRQELVEELRLLVPCRGLLDQVGLKEGRIRVSSQGRPFAEIEMQAGARSQSRPPEEVPAPLAHDLNLVSERAARLLPTARAAALCAGFTVLAVLGPQDDIASHLLLALLGSAPPTLEPLPNVGILYVPSAKEGRNDRALMAEALEACAARSPAWIAVDVPLDIYKTDNQQLLNKISQLKEIGVSVLVSVSTADAVDAMSDQLGEISVLDPAKIGGPLRLRSVTVEVPMAEGGRSKTRRFLGLSVAAKLQISGRVEVFEQLIPDRGPLHTTPDIVLGAALHGKLRCAQYAPGPTAQPGDACAAGQGTILAFTDWTRGSDSGHPDLHTTWVAGDAPLPEACWAGASTAARGRDRLPGPVYLNALALTLAAGSPYRTTGDALSELWSRNMPQQAARLVGDLSLPNEHPTRTVRLTGAGHVIGPALYLALLMFLSPQGYARSSRRPLLRVARGLPFTVHFFATLGCLLFLRILTPVITGAVLTLSLAFWSDRLPRITSHYKKSEGPQEKSP